MEFKNYKCPVCDKQFKAGDDIVVCPECGAPHHRECYENLNHCFYKDKHSDTFSFEETQAKAEAENSDDENETIICPKCNEENPKATFYCTKCGFPLNEQDRKSDDSSENSQNQQNNTQGMPPFGIPFGANPQQFNMAFDPMAGFKNDEPIGENVTAGEMSKFVGKNTPYFLRVFGNIKRFGSSRFNFSAFLFSGAYFLYRKMFVIGILITIVILGLTVGDALIKLSPAFQDVYSAVMANYQNAAYSTDYYSSLFAGMTSNDMILFFAPTILELIKYILMFVCGFIANRTYYKHCVKKISKLKNKEESVNINDKLEAKGGVNLPVAICLGVAYIAVIYLPLFL